MSRRINVPEVGELADKTLVAMKELSMIPDSSCYGSAILAWKHVATNRECEDRDASAKRALELLREMTQAYHRTTKTMVKPTTADYNHVLEALAVSKSPRTTDNAEMLLGAMEEADQDGEAPGDVDECLGLRPNADSYRLVIDIWRDSRSLSKVASASQILERMKKRHAKLVQLSQTEDLIVAVFSAFIRVCAHPSVRHESDRMEIMKTALRSVEDLRSLNLQPNAGTYTALLEACRHLLPEGTDRQKILENVFRKCCQDGYVDQGVLEEFQLAASSFLYSKLVVAPSREVEGVKVVPESWTRNIKGFSANTRDGRKVLPLSIEGKFTFTVAAAEYKMRKLRRRGNQRMLQGGRMK
jgi:hypothetical protein